MRYYKTYVAPINIRGARSSRHTAVYRNTNNQSGGGLVGQIFKGGVRMAKKHVFNRKNMKSAGKFAKNIFLSEGKRLLNKHKKQAIQTASDVIQKESKKILRGEKPDTAGIKKGIQEMKIMAKPDLQQAVENVKKEVKVKAKSELKKGLTPNNSLLLSNILAGSGITQKRRGRPMKGAGIKYV